VKVLVIASVLLLPGCLSLCGKIDAWAAHWDDTSPYTRFPDDGQHGDYRITSAEGNTPGTWWKKAQRDIGEYRVYVTAYKEGPVHYNVVDQVEPFKRPSDETIRDWLSDAFTNLRLGAIPNPVPELKGYHENTCTH